MKNFALPLLLTLISFNMYGQNTFISGNIISQKSDSVHVYHFKERTKVELGSAALKDGAFEIQLDLDTSILAFFNDGNEVAEIILSPGDDLNITINTILFDETVVYSGKGAQVNNMLNKIYLIKEKQDQELYQAIEDTNKTKKEILNIVEDHHKILSDVIINATEVNSLISLKYHDYEASSEKYLKKTKEMVSSRLDYLSAVKSLLNTEAINIKGVDLNGEETELSKYKGQTIVIDFWATWCGPCKAEMPSLHKLEEKFGKDIAFVGVGVFCKQDAWAEMAKDFEIKNNIYLSKEDMAQIQTYQVQFIPRYIVIDENFKIIDADAPRPSSGELEKYF